MKNPFTNMKHSVRYQLRTVLSSVISVAAGIAAERVAEKVSDENEYISTAAYMAGSIGTSAILGTINVNSEKKMLVRDGIELAIEDYKKTKPLYPSTEILPAVAEHALIDACKKHHMDAGKIEHSTYEELTCAICKGVQMSLDEANKEEPEAANAELAGA